MSANLEKQLTELISRLETVTKRLETVEGKVASGASNTPAAPTSASVEEYQGLIDQFIVPLVDASGKMGDAVVKQQADLLLQAVQAQKAFLSIAVRKKMKKKWLHLFFSLGTLRLLSDFSKN